MANFDYEIVDHYAQLSENAKGWTKELTAVSWNGREAKYDLREWAPDYSRMSKGITLTTEELRLLRDALNKMDLKA